MSTYNETLSLLSKTLQNLDCSSSQERRIRLGDFTLFVSNNSILCCEGQGVFRANFTYYTDGIVWYSHAPSIESGNRQKIMTFLIESLSHEST